MSEEKATDEAAVEAQEGKSKARKKMPWPYVLIVLVAFLITEFVARQFVEVQDDMETLFGQRLLPYPVLFERQRDTLAARDLTNYFQADEELGWTIKPGGKGQQGLYHANAIGLRTSELRPVPDPDRADRFRVLLLGDSYTHGDEVSHEETWGAALGRRLGEPWEVWNGGVSGYGTDQAFLRGQQLLEKVRPRVAILGIYRENILRNCTFFRPVKHRWTGFPFGKPRFVLKDGEELDLRHQPVTRPEDVPSVLATYSDRGLSAEDLLYDERIYTSGLLDVSLLARWFRSRQVLAAEHDRRQELMTGQGEGVMTTARIALRFAYQFKDAGVRPIVLLLPGRDDLRSHAPGEQPTSRHLIRELDRLGITAEDAAPALHGALESGDDPSVYYMRDGAGHLNARAGEVIARWLAPIVQRN